MSFTRKIDNKPIYFATEDKLEFLNIISKYKSFFECSNKTEYSLKRKRDIWNLIEQEYNERSPISGTRTVEQLQSLYKNLKRKAKNDALREINKYNSVKQIPVITAEELVEQINGTIDIEDLKTLQENDHNYIITPSESNSEDIEDISASTSKYNLINEEIFEEPVVNIETMQNSVCTKRFRRRFSDNPHRLKSEPVLNSRRFIEEQNKLKLRLLKTEYEAKKREISLNYEISLLQKEVICKQKENATLEKKIKFEEMQEKKVLIKLQQENELLKQKLLKLEIEKLQNS